MEIDTDPTTTTPQGQQLPEQDRANLQGSEKMNVDQEEMTDSILDELTKVMTDLQSNPFDHESHLKNINLCKSLGIEMVDEYDQARNLMIGYFQVGQDFFSGWISDIKSFFGSPYDQGMIERVLEIYEQASSYGFFPKLESERLEFLIELYYDSRSIRKPGGDLLGLIEGSSSSEEEESDPMEVDPKESNNKDLTEEDRSRLQEFVTEDRIRTVAVDVIDRVGYHLVESSSIWNLWALHEFTILKEDSNEERLSRFKTMLQSRLRVPHLDSAKTFQIYSTFITKYENDSYEEELVSANSFYGSAKKLVEDRESRETQLKKSGHSSEEYLRYLSWEVSRKPIEFDLCFVLFERSLVDHPNLPELWTEFLRFLSQCKDQPMLPVSIARRATRAIPWSGDVWAAAIRAFERNNQPVEVVEELCERAIKSKFLEHDVESIVSFTIGRADFHRRRLEAYISAGGSENLEQVSNLIESVTDPLRIGIDQLKKLFPKSGDPSCRLEKYLTSMYERFEKVEEGSKVWEKSTKRYRESYLTWLSAIEFEIRRENYSKARDYYKRSSNVKLDYPEYLLQSWVSFEHLFGNLDELEHSIFKVNNLMKGISSRRRREAEQEIQKSSNYGYDKFDERGKEEKGFEIVKKEVSNDKDGLDHNSISGSNSNSGRKRKAENERGGEALNGEEKKVKFADEKVQGSGEQVELKRDRENSTVLLTGLRTDTTEAQIKQLFRDCGKIRETVIHKVDSSEVVATVEFWDRSSVLEAQTKDKKILNDQEVSINLAWRSTLFVTNFSEDVKDDWIREKFSRYGKIFDVRWPSKRFKSNRRFCYVQFTSPASAESALELNDSEVTKNEDDGQGSEDNPKQRLIVLISDPAKKQIRSDFNSNERELYITCLSKFVQETDLRKIFSPFGEILGVRLILDSNGHSKGFAFVEFKDEASAKAALSLNNFELKKRRIGVTISNSKGLQLSKNKKDDEGSNKFEKRLSSISDQRMKSIKVSKLPKVGVQEALIQQGFERFGKVLKVLTFFEKNEALVEFESEKDAGKVILNPEPIVINGQEVEVSLVSNLPLKGSSTETSHRNKERSSSKVESQGNFVPLLPRRSILKAKQKSRVGIGFNSSSSNNSNNNNQNKTDDKDDGNQKNFQSVSSTGKSFEDGQTSGGSDKNLKGKSQDDFRKMLLG